MQAFKTAYKSTAPGQLAGAVASSAEFTAFHAGQSDATFVDSLYHAGLGRPAEAAGLAVWTGKITDGQSRSSVLLSIATSAEAGLHLTHNLSV